MQQVSSRLGETTRGSLYLLFNPNLVFSDVLRTVQNGLFRKAMTRLRSSSYHLKIETDTWHN